ncbi:MAG: hypothetical protein A2018_05705 [Alphaproteobacteria bacterium GWF2_58_20]|nr:MAG: hypothetical protein A2018_05705 [Alphaproteobacteria bacterium GWF2_58_20]
MTFVYIQDTKGRSGNSFMGFNQKPINPMKCVIDPVLDGYDILDFYPRSIENIPENLPQPIEDLFREALGLLNEEQKNAAAMTLRKTLEVALETYAPEFKKKKLGEQIILLASDGRLTPSMKDWAREIKIDGDDGVHEHEPPTLQRNKETAEFTRVLLTYLFTLPAMIEKRRQAREAHKKQS